MLWKLCTNCSWPDNDVSRDDAILPYKLVELHDCAGMIFCTSICRRASIWLKAIYLGCWSSNAMSCWLWLRLLLVALQSNTKKNANAWIPRMPMLQEWKAVNADVQCNRPYRCCFPPLNYQNLGCNCYLRYYVSPAMMVKRDRYAAHNPRTQKLRSA